MKFTNVITNYLDGDPCGIRRCRIEGSVIEAIIIPNDKLPDAKSLAKELPSRGIYYLVEDKEGVNLPKIYAGQTTNGIGRLYDHKSNKSYWTQAIMFMAKDEHFQVDIIGALESLAIDGIWKSERYDSDNKVGPKCSINIYQKSVVEKYFEEIKFLMATFGWPVDKKASCPQCEWRTSRNGVVAYGNYCGAGGFEVLPGSQIAIDKPVTLQSYNKLRSNLLAEGHIVKDAKGHYILKKVVHLKTPSGASDFALGGSTNGWDEWKNAKGEKLDVIRKNRR